MKLWLKIFLCVFAVTAAAINVTALLILNNSHHHMVENERQIAAASHSRVVEAIKKSLTLRRSFQWDTMTFYLPSEVLEIAVEVLSSEFDGMKTQCVLLDTDWETVYRNDNVLTDYQDLLLQSENTSDYVTKITKTAQHDNYILSIASQIRLEGQYYYLVTESYIGRVYIDLENMIQTTQYVSMGFALFFGLLLMAIVWRLMSPLSKSNTVIKRISGGKYSLRMPVEGSIEFRELAGNINDMAQSIESHIEKLEELSEGRKRFVDSFAHEMKTPLTSILGFADILRVKRFVSDEQRVEYAGAIVDEAKRLRELSRKILQLATSENTALELEAVYLPELFRDIGEKLTEMLRQSKIELTVSAPPLSVKAERDLLVLLLYNLLDNAVKASYPNGTIELSARIVSDKVRLCVADHGRGMSEETLRHAVEAFYMEDKSRSRQAGGAGLGLTLCQEIAVRHGSNLVLHSMEGKGTSACLDLEEAGGGRK